MVVLSPPYINTVFQGQNTSFNDVIHPAVNKSFCEHFGRMDIVLGKGQGFSRKKYFKVNRRTNYDGTTGGTGMFRNYYLITTIYCAGRPNCIMDMQMSFYSRGIF